MMPPFMKRNQKKRGLNHESKATIVPRMCKSVSKGLPGSESRTPIKDCEVIGSVGVKEFPSCPCCKRNLNESRQTVGETRIQALYSSLFKDDGSETESCHSCDDMDEEGSIMFGVLSGGTHYSVTKNLVQGWVHKKGTGTDWFGSRAWKPRWAVLSLARIPGHEVEVPLLQIFWFPNSSTPSTVIHLDSAVVLPQDQSDKWNCHRFQIQHVRKSIDESTIQITRSFSCTRDGRDAWCQAISKSLLDYEKEKALVRQQSRCATLSQRRWRSLIGWATGDAHPSAAKMTPPVNNSTLAPSSPGSPPRDLPRHEPALIGESFLAQIMEL